MTALDPAFLSVPLAHRALHDASAGRPENGPSAVRAALEAGYGIEIDVQLTSDGRAAVFHDGGLDRLTAETGPVRDRTMAALEGLHLTGSDDRIPCLEAVLALVDGAVPVLIEIKDQDGGLGPDIGPLEAAVARAATGYRGPLAVMSFNPHSVAEMARLAPDLPRGLTTCDFASDDWRIDDARRAHLAEIADYDRVGASFVSHFHKRLNDARIAELKRAGAGILCWTIRSPAEEAAARSVAHTITFERYLPAFPVA